MIGMKRSIDRSLDIAPCLVPRRRGVRVAPLARTLLLLALGWSLLWANRALPAQAGASPGDAISLATSRSGPLPSATPLGAVAAPAQLRLTTTTAATPPAIPPLPAPFPLHGDTGTAAGHRVLPASAGRAASLTIDSGWNLISPALASITASRVLTTLLANTGGSLAALYSLTGDAWTPSFLQHGSATSGTNFTLTPGKGYLLYSDAPGNLALAGTPPAAPPPWSLAYGWNLVGLPEGAGSAISAIAVLHSLLGATHASVAALFGLSGSTWTSRLIATGTTISGDPFDLQPGSGYLLYTDTADAAFALPGVIPPDPASVAPPLDTEVATTVFSDTSFLYSAPDPIQTGVLPGTIVSTRAAVLRGRVLTTAGEPLPGVTIAVQDHPEFGETLSRADGMFDLAVNGGGLLTVTYSKDGYVPVQRHAQTPWQDFARLPDVVLTAYDANVTPITLAAGAPLQVARGSVISDASGVRRATLLFPPGTTATMTLPDGTTQPLSTLHVRATELTVGVNGPDAMPGELPPTSGYTYAADFSVDEATQTGAISVTFSQPVYGYVENFLGFPTGMAVPSGYYNRARGEWVPSQNGLVIAILDVVGGKAVLDVDGDGQPDGGAKLSVLHITDAELRELGSLYHKGQSLWRVPLAHFSNFDLNWPYGCPLNADGSIACVPPNQPLPFTPPCPCQQTQTGSIIGVQTQTLGEDVPIAGTPFRLHYGSDRVPGRTPEHTLTIPLSGATIPQKLVGITLEVDVAGQQITRDFSAATNQTTTVTWDGKDAYGRTVQGAQPVTVRLGYVYPAVYLGPAPLAASFSWLSQQSYSGVRLPAGRGSVTIWQTWHSTLGGWNDALASAGLGGWTLDVQHSYDPVGRVLYQGDGTQRDAAAMGAVITSVAGARNPAPDPGDGLPATEVQLGNVQDTAVGPDGSLYIVDGPRVVRMGADGRLTSVAGTGTSCIYTTQPIVTCGDGGPATEAGLANPTGIAVGSDGSLYIADQRTARIRRVDPQGIISTVAGAGRGQDPDGFSGDGGPATQAMLSNPDDVAVGPDGSLYIADTDNNRIRRVDPHTEIISTVAGTGSPGCSIAGGDPSACFGGDGGPATQAKLAYPTAVIVAPDGSLYIADTGNDRIRRVDPRGIISTVAGNGSPGCTAGSEGSNTAPCYGGDGGPATSAALDGPADVALGSDGTLYIADLWNNRIRRVAPNGTISTMVGTGTEGLTGDGGSAVWATLTYPAHVTAGEGGIYLTSEAGYDNRVRHVGASGAIDTVAGWSVNAHGDGSSAVVGVLGAVQAVAPGADGSAYFVDREFNTVRRVSANGILTTVAGGGPAQCADPSGDCGDGGPATLATLAAAQGIAVAPDGGIYIADDARIRRVGPDGIISTIAGTGQACDEYSQNPATFCGDGGPASAAQLLGATSVAVGPSGALYIADGAERVRAIMPDGTIDTVAGGGTTAPTDGMPATQARLDVENLAVGPDGSLYIATGQRVFRVGTDGTLTTVAGGGTGACYNPTDACGDGGPATQAELSDADAVALGADGSLYIADDGINRVRRVDPAGYINTVAGNGLECDSLGGDSVPLCGDGGPASDAQISYPSAVAVLPDGRLCIGGLDPRIRCVGPALAGLTLGDSLIPSADAGEVYVFDAEGRHLLTVDALTGALRYRFGYDGAGHLSSVTDGDGNTTKIVRDSSGNPTAIVAPGGQRTTVIVDANGYLKTIADPAGDITTLTSSATGLLTSLTDPNGNVHQFKYDDQGRLIKDADPAGGSTTLARIETTDGYTVTATTALTRTTTYTVQRLPSGVIRETTTDPSGVQTILDVGTDDSRTIHYPDGTTEAQTLGPDPRFGQLAPVLTSDTVTTPSGLVRTTTRTRTAVLANPDDPFTLQRQTEAVSVNGHTTTSVYDAATHTITGTSAAGRRTSTTLDGEGRVTSEGTQGQAMTQFGYDAQGRLHTITRGARTFTLDYDAANNLVSVTDPLSHTTLLTPDAAGRVTTIQAPDGQQMGLGYTANSMVTRIITAGSKTHTFTYTPVDLLQTYTPPPVTGATGSTVYTYDVDRQVMRIERPGAATIALSYDQGGRVRTVTTPTEALTYAYNSGSGALHSVSGSDGNGIAMNYDGALLTGMTWTGAISGTVQDAYNDDLRASQERVDGAQPISLGYDADGRLTTAGAETISYNPQTGLIVGTATAGVTDTWRLDQYGEIAGYSASRGSTALYSASYGRDAAGRVITATETLDGTTHTSAYVYDATNRLTQATLDGVTTTYGYNANGDRTSVDGPGGRVTADYDGQDRLISAGSMTYHYSADGDLSTAADGATGKQTTYTYDALGNLTGVQLPDGRSIDYTYDATGERIGKSIDGTPTLGFLYDGPLGPIAELDGQNHVVSRFVYGSHPNVPDYMIKNGVTYRIIADRLGSPRLVVDTADGTIAQRLDYDAWGRVTTDTNPGFQPFGFAGGLYDPDTALVRFGARDYDPRTGRWTAKDPLSFQGGSGDLYQYAQDDPVNLIDPSGLFGIGVYGGATGELGAFGFGGAGSVSIGAGLFSGGTQADGTPIGANAGGFLSYGGFAGGNSYGYSSVPASCSAAPRPLVPVGFVLGLTAGAGAGIFITNAASVSDLSGPFNTINLNFGPVSVNIAYGNGIWQIGASIGPTVGASVSTYQTNTVTTKAY